MNNARPLIPSPLRSGALFGLLMLGLTACASKVDSPTTYMLPTTVPEQQYSTTLGLAIAPVSISSYLDNEGIVMELNDIEVYQARQHLWAEDIGKQLQQQLQQQLAASLPRAQVVLKGQTLQSNMPHREVRVSVSRFQGSYEGSAIAQGQWQLLDAKGQLLKQQSFKLEQPLTRDGYPTLVRALGAAWDKVASELATAVALASEQER